MASIDKRPSGKWRARYRVHAGGPQRSKHFDRKTDAERFLTRVQGQVLDGSYVDPSAGQVSFGEYAESWRKAQVHRRSTVVQVDAYLRNHMLPTFGDRPLASIRPSEVQAWVRGRSDVLAATTVETVFRIFSTILSDAVRDRLIIHSPARNIRLPRKAKSAIVPPTVDQVEAVIAEMPDRYQALLCEQASTRDLKTNRSPEACRGVGFSFKSPTSTLGRGRRFGAGPLPPHQRHLGGKSQADTRMR
ncbi:MAG: hypothetical protein OSA99_20535 [Acidimicrobiales bacterium]|nr:hypothetical protein [Acidimicrobiales bacterium]